MSKLIDKQFPIINFDEVIPDEYKVKSRNIYKFMPKHPSLAILSAGSGRGKTNLLLNIICKGMLIDKMYIFMRDDSEDKYRWLNDLFIKINEEYNKHANKKRKLEDIFVMTNDLSKIPKLNDLDKDKQNVIVFDDLVSSSPEVLRSIKILYEACRKKNTSVFFLTQTFFGVPKGIRLNANFVCLWSTGSRKEQRELTDTFAVDMDYKDFERIITYACRKSKHSFLTINDKQDDLKDKFRLNLSEPLPDEFFPKQYDDEKSASEE